MTPGTLADSIIQELFAVALAASIIGSLFLWFIRGRRSGLLLNVLYLVRLSLGFLLLAVAIRTWDVLVQAADPNAVFGFVGPIGLAGLFCVIPWGAIARASRRKARKPLST